VLEQQPSNPDSWSTKGKTTEISRDIARDSARGVGITTSEPARGGWTGEAVAPQERGHPLIEQKEILRGYLRQVGYSRTNSRKSQRSLIISVMLFCRGQTVHTFPTCGSFCAPVAPFWLGNV